MINHRFLGHAYLNCPYEGVPHSTNFSLNRKKPLERKLKLVENRNEAIGNFKG